jgi:hypothetical protein
MHGHVLRARARGWTQRHSSRCGWLALAVVTQQTVAAAFLLMLFTDSASYNARLYW